MPKPRSSIDKSLAEFGYPQAAPAPFLSAALTAAAQIYAKGGQLNEAESFAAAALRLSESIARDSRQSADVGEALLVLGSVKNARGDKTTAADYARRSVEALTNSLGQQHRLTQQRYRVIEVSRDETWFSAITHLPSRLRIRRVLMPSCGFCGRSS